MPPLPWRFCDKETLLNRVQNAERKVVFCVGSPLVAPEEPTALGVPDVRGLVSLIEDELARDPPSPSEAPTSSWADRYMAAFQRLIDRRGVDRSNAIIRQAVLKAFRADKSEHITDLLSRSLQGDGDACAQLETSLSHWHVRPSLFALGEILAGHPVRFGQPLLTTNFDPLIEVAVRRAGGTCYRSVLHGDGSLDHVSGDGCHIVHLHGYWYGADTLHTPTQLRQNRPHLDSSLRRLLARRTLVVLAYGGWDDAFTRVVSDLASDPQAYPDIIWTFHSDAEFAPLYHAALLERLRPMIERGRITLFSSIDVHRFLLSLRDKLLTETSASTSPDQPRPRSLEKTSHLDRGQDRLLQACRVQVQHVLHDLRSKYDPDLYVDRAMQLEIAHFLDTRSPDMPRCFLLVSPAGSGKTNLLCDLARTRASTQPVVFLLGSTTYLASGNDGIIGAVAADLALARPDLSFATAAECLHGLITLGQRLRHPFTLFLDGINEHDSPAQMRRALGSLIRATSQLDLKIVFTCRDYYWHLFKGDFWTGHVVNSLPSDAEKGAFTVFADSEHALACRRYFAHYEISVRLGAAALKQTSHPLLLRFFCEAYRGQNMGVVDDIRLKELFDRYWSQKLQSIAERRLHQGEELLVDHLADEAGRYLLRIAIFMLRNNVRSIPRDRLSEATGAAERIGDPRSLYGRIRDEFIILEERDVGKAGDKAVHVAFVYEEFMEYAIARALTQDWDERGLSDQDIVIELEQLTQTCGGFSQILGVTVYLVLMLKEQRNLALWSALLRKGSQWETVVLESIRKLPERELDAGVFEALSGLVASGNGDTRIRVLNLVGIRRVARCVPQSFATLIVGLTNDKNAAVSRKAIRMLGYLPAAFVLSRLLEILRRGRPSQRRIAVWNNAVSSLTALGKEDPAVVGRLLVEARGPSWQAAAEAAERLKAITLIEPIIRNLQDPDFSIRSRAAAILGGYRDSRSVDALIAACGDANGKVRAAASTALAQLGDPRAVEPLVASMRLGALSASVKALATFRDSRAVEPLIALLETREAEVARDAATALGEIGGLRAIEALIGFIRTHLGESLPAEQALITIGIPAIPHLQPLLEDESSTVREAASNAIHRIQTSRPRP
jgi:HEAT repeat protein